MDEKELINKLIGYVESVSPEVWRIALQQVGVKVWQAQATVTIAVIVFIIFLPLMLLTFRKIRRDWDKIYQNDTEIGWVFLLVYISIVSIISFFVAVGNTIHLVSLQMNPEFYAIQIIFNIMNK